MNEGCTRFNDTEEPDPVILERLTTIPLNRWWLSVLVGGERDVVSEQSIFFGDECDDDKLCVCVFACQVY